MACPNPLRPEDCETLNRALQAIHDTKELIAKCKECGIPVDDQESTNNSMHETVTKVKRAFFPHNT